MMRLFFICSTNEVALPSSPPWQVPKGCLGQSGDPILFLDDAGGRRWSAENPPWRIVLDS